MTKRITKIPARQTDDATQYALDVVSGQLPAGPLVIGACKRHLAELEMQGTEDFPYVWNPVKLAQIVNFASNLKHYKGEFAKQPIDMMHWQRFIVGSIFCWVHMDTGLRRFRTAYVEVPRKNAKSALAAIICLWMLMMDGESGAEIYTMATKKDQAKLVYRDALTFLPAWAKAKHLTLLGTQQGSQLAIHQKTESRMMPLGRDSTTLDGLNPHLGVCDEIHEWKNSDLWEVVEDGMGSRTQPLMFGITTAGNNKEGPAMALRDTASDIAKGAGDRSKFVLDTFFGYVACPDEKDRENWRDERVWRIANPGMGISKHAEFMRVQAAQADKVPSKRNSFLNKQLNFWTDAAEAWIPSELWDSMAVDREELYASCAGQKCFGGLDLAQTTDLSALSLFFPPTESTGLRSKWRLLVWHWCPKVKATNRENSDNVNYLRWAEAGLIDLTEGEATSFKAIRLKIESLHSVYQIHSIAYDRYLAAETVQNLTAENVEMLAMGQGFTSMSPPTKEIQRKLLQRTIAHAGNPLFDWEMGNVVIELDPAGLEKPNKKKSKKRIDGPVSFVMAQGAAMQVVEEEKFSGLLCAVIRRN